MNNQKISCREYIKLIWRFLWIGFNDSYYNKQSKTQCIQDFWDNNRGVYEMPCFRRVIYFYSKGYDFGHRIGSIRDSLLEAQE
jgi:hypothetical protein